MPEELTDPSQLEGLRVSVMSCLVLSALVLVLCAAVFLFAHRLYKDQLASVKRIHERLDSLDRKSAP